MFSSTGEGSPKAGEMGIVLVKAPHASSTTLAWCRRPSAEVTTTLPSSHRSSPVTTEKWILAFSRPICRKSFCCRATIFCGWRKPAVPDSTNCSGCASGTRGSRAGKDGGSGDGLVMDCCWLHQGEGEETEQLEMPVNAHGVWNGPIES
jgi:hypothetical protein